MAEDEHDQRGLGGDAVEVVVGAVFPEGVACCEEHGAEGVETEELPCFVATGVSGLEGISSKPGENAEGGLQALPDVEDGREPIRQDEEDGCASVGSVDVQTVQDWVCVNHDSRIGNPELDKGRNSYSAPHARSC